MSTQSYRLTVVACALLWLLVGMHAPIVHEITHHGRVPGPAVIVVVGLILVAAIGALLVLLRMRQRTVTETRR